MQTTRRNFLKQSLTTVAGLGMTSILPTALAAGHAQSSANETLVVGLIGCKGMGYANLADFLKQPNVACTALCDIDDEWLNKRAEDVKNTTGKKPKLYKDFRKLLERKDIDAVIIGTPDHWHCLPLVYACEAGMDVYVEKPLANSIGECDIMLRAARKYNRIVQVGQQQRSGKHWAEAIQFVQGGQLGKIRRISIWANFNYGAGRPVVPDEPVPPGVDFDMWLGPAPERTFNRNRFHGSWRMFWDYGGGLMTDWGVHLLDMGLWAINISTPPKSVTAVGGIFASQGNAVETADTQSVIYEFDDFIMTWNHDAGIQSGPYARNYGVAFRGTNGTLVADRDNWEVLPEGGDEDRRMEPVPPQLSDHLSHENHVKDFIDCVKTRKTPACDIQIGRNAAFYAHLGNIAYRTGHKLIWDEQQKQFSNCKAANMFVTPTYRKPWELPEI